MNWRDTNVDNCYGADKKGSDKLGENTFSNKTGENARIRSSKPQLKPNKEENEARLNQNPETMTAFQLLPNITY